MSDERRTVTDTDREAAVTPAVHGRASAPPRPPVADASIDVYPGGCR